MHIKGVIKGILFSYIIAAFVVFISAVVTYFGLIDERVAGIAVFAGAVIGVFIGAFGAVKASEGKVLFHALAVSLGFIALVIAAASAVNGSIEIHTRTWALIGSAAASGLAAALFAK